jgi:hypothetical protein
MFMGCRWWNVTRQDFQTISSSFTLRLIWETVNIIVSGAMLFGIFVFLMSFGQESRLIPNLSFLEMGA